MGREYEEWSMSNVKSDTSGLPGMIYIWVNSPAKLPHWARIKVSNVRGKFREGDSFTVSITEDPKVKSGTPANFDAKELQAVFDWVHVNRKVLLEFWVADNMEFEEIKPRLVKWSPELAKELRVARNLESKHGGVGGSDGR